MPCKATCCMQGCGRNLNTNDKRYDPTSSALFPYLAAAVPEEDLTRTLTTPSPVICGKCRMTLLKPMRRKNADGQWYYDSTEKQHNEPPTPEEVERSYENGSEKMDHDVTTRTCTGSSEHVAEHSEQLTSSEELLHSNEDCPIDISLSINSASSVVICNMKKDTVRLPGMTSVRATQSKCCVCGSKAGRSRVPVTAIMQTWSEVGIIIPDDNRCCKVHLVESTFTADALQLIKTNPGLKSYTDMNQNRIVSWINDMTKFLKSQRSILNFDKDSKFNTKDFEVLLGVNKENFEVMFGYCSKDIKCSRNRYWLGLSILIVSNVKVTEHTILFLFSTSRNALALFLMKLRLNLSQRVLAILFGMNSLSSVSRAISSVMKCLSKSFVPKYLGFQHLSREEMIKTHSREFFTKVLQANADDLILIVDGTYLYIQKPTNMTMQKKTYSGHKHTNLFKSMMVVLPSGYPIATKGLFFADGDNNDAKILKGMLRNEDSLLGVLQTRDKIIMDRGFRDCEEDLKSTSVDYFMPKFLKKDQEQFTCAEANETRQVTACRFIVETANARPKNKFKFFDHKILASYFPKVDKLWDIALAIINAFSPPLFNDNEFHRRMATKLLKKLEETTNTLMEEVNSWGDDEVEPQWIAANEDSVLEFPTLTSEDIHEVCLGSYQPRLATLNNKQHTSDAVGYKFYVAKRENGLIKVKMQSRHVKRQKYLVWIRFEEFGYGVEAVKGHYCKCKVGMRTVGCCGHIAAVLSFLGFERFEEPKKYRDLYSSILDAAEELSKETDENEEVDLPEDDEDAEAFSDMEESGEES